jgi:hypothetical protein
MIMTIELFHKIKLYLAAFGFEAFLIQMHYGKVWDSLDNGLRRLTLWAGLIVAVLTAVKLYQDISKTRLEKKKLRLDIKKQEGA